MAITPLPVLDRTDPTFKTDVDTFFATDLPLFSVETEAARVAIVASEAATSASASSASTSASTATTQAGIATTQAGIATTKASEAAASAASAVLSAGTSATSTTSLTIGAGTQNFTIQTGKAFVIGQTVIIANTPVPTTQMSGVLTAYDSGSGNTTVVTDSVSGSGTYTAWTISLSGVKGVAGSSTSVGNNIFLYNYF